MNTSTVPPPLCTAPIAVVYLARGHEAGFDVAERFFESYDRHPAGLAHDLVVLVKGWDGVDGLDYLYAMAHARSVRIIELPDDGFDIGAYFRASQALSHEWVCFFNSFSYIQADNWLDILYRAASQPGVGAVGCSGNWGAMTNFFCRDIFASIKYARLYTAVRCILRGIASALRYWPYIPAFPNPHIRTNAFIIRCILWREFFAQSKIPANKKECYILEHGRKGLTRFLESKGLQALVAGADGRVFTPDLFLESGTFHVPGIPNLLAYDNQTDEYLVSSGEIQRQLEYGIWGRVLTPLPEGEDSRPTAREYRRKLLCRVARMARYYGVRYVLMVLEKCYPSLAKRIIAYPTFCASDNAHPPAEMSVVDSSPLRYTPWPPFMATDNVPLYLPPRDLMPPFFAPIRVLVARGDACKKAYANIVLPSTSVKHSSGGPNTAYTLVAELVKMGIPVRILAVTMPADEDSLAMREHIARIGHLTPQQAMVIEFLDASDRDRPVQLGENDIFIATAWWTAQMVKYILPLFKVKEFVYLIQDFEPLIHNASTNYALALETYFLDIFPIFNSSLLRDYFIQEKVGRFADATFAAQSLCFEPAVDTTLFYPSQRLGQHKKKRLLFYARPGAERNLLEIGIGALMKILADKSCNPEEWEFLSSDTGVAGQCCPVVLSDAPLTVLTPLAVRDFTTWAEEMRNVDIMLSLILSPHTSYPPLEAAACGALVVTNTWSVKNTARLRQISPNIIAGTASIEGIAKALAKAINICAEGKSVAKGGAPLLTSPRSWEESWQAVMPRLLAFLAKHDIVRA